MKFLSNILLKAGLVVEGTTDLQGTATAVTQTLSDSSTKLATTAFVKGQGYAVGNIYSTDGSLSGNRTITLNGNYLDIVGTTRTRYFSNGNIVIGQASPVDAGFKLDVNGTTRLGGGMVTIGKASTAAQSLKVVASRADNSAVMTVTNESESTTFFSINGSSGLTSANSGILVNSILNITAQDISVKTDTSSQSAANLSIKGGSQNFQNRAGGNLLLQGGAAAGAGDGTNGYISFSTTNSGAASGVTNTVSEAARITINKNFLLGITTDAGFRLDVNGTVRLQGETRLTTLAGTGSRMVVADSSGVLSTQAIPSGGTVTSIATTGPITGGTITTTGTIGITQATSSTDGYLSSTDWTTFNSKQDALTNPVTGTGTSGQVAFWNGTTTQTGDNGLFWDNTNKRLGIGTNSPSFDLQVNGNVRFGSSATLINNTYYDNTTFRLGIGVISPTRKLDVSDNGSSLIANFRSTSGDISAISLSNNSSTADQVRFGSNQGNLTLSTNFTERFRIVSNGNVLINTTTDAGFRLDVNGTARVSGQLTANSFVPTSSTIPTNGMYLSGTNTLGFATNGTLDMTINEVGSVGIGTTSLTGYNLRVSKNVTGATSSFGIVSDGNVQSDVTSQANYFRTLSSTQAATFTTFISHYAAEQGTHGAGSTVSEQYGFIAQNSLVGATTNYGFYGNIPSGTGRWNLYMNGTAANFMAGSLGIGSTSLTNTVLRVAKSNTGATAFYGITSEGATQSDVTSQMNYFATFAATQATTFTLSSIVHFRANQSTFGAGSTVTNQYGVFIDASLTGATNNFGFYGNIASGTNRWNLYMNGTADNHLGGKLTIGSATTSSNSTIYISRAITGSASSNGIIQELNVSSDVTTQAFANRTILGTAAASFTLPILSHYVAGQGTIGAGSTVTTQIGYWAQSNMIGATTNIGFYGDIASGTNRWNIYMNGTANNYMAGALGIGATGLAGYNLRISLNPSAATSYGIMLDGLALSSVTTSYHINRTLAQTQSATFTLPELAHYYATQGTFGAGSTVTNQYGFIVGGTLIGATNNYGFYGNINSGTNRWNLYMNGTAANYMAGTLAIGNTNTTYALDVNGVINTRGSAAIAGVGLSMGYLTSNYGWIQSFGSVPLLINASGNNVVIGGTSSNASARLQIDSTNSGFLPPRMTSAQRTAISTPAEGLIVYQTDGTVGLYIYSNATWRSLTMV